MALIPLTVGTVVALIVISLVSWASSHASSTNAGASTNSLVGTVVKPFGPLPGLDGGTVSAPYAAGHPTVVMLMASWCDPCKAEMPSIAAYLRTHSTGDVRVVAVDTNDQRASAQAFVRRDGVTFPVAFDQAASVATTTFGFLAIPDTVFLNAHGRVVAVVQGRLTVARLRAGITSLR